MTTRLSGYQPQYFPRLHYFARLLDSDIFEFSDYLQFVKKHQYPLPDGSFKRGKSYQADASIKSEAGLTWLTVPVQQHDKQRIHETPLVEDRTWVRKHLRTVEVNYAGAEQYARIRPQLVELLSQPYRSLADLNIATTLWGLTQILGAGEISASQLTLETVNGLLAGRHPFRLKRLVRMSQTSVAPSGAGRDATDWIVETCRQLGAGEYYFGGTSAAAYMDLARLRQAGIQLVQQAWVCQPYHQQFPQYGFMPNLSILDLVANEGSSQTQAILQGVVERVHTQTLSV